MVGGNEGVGLPEAGIIPLLHVLFPFRGASFLPDDHRAVLPDSGLQYHQLHFTGKLLLHFRLQWTLTIAGV